MHLADQLLSGVHPGANKLLAPGGNPFLDSAEGPLAFVRAELYEVRRC